METPIITYSRSEEIANTISHVIGFVVAFVAILFLVIEGLERLTMWGNVGVWAYGISLLMMFASSSLYHGVTNARLKLAFKKLDHISIYFLISGSYSILILNRLMNEKGVMFLVALWGMSLVGIWFKARYVHRFKVLSTVIYGLMAYIIVLDPWLFFGVLGRDAKILLLLSGALYTVGAGFYLWKSQKWTHFTWHIFVIVAAGLHYTAMYMELFS